MSGFADVSGTRSFPAYVGTTAPNVPTNGMIWYNPETTELQIYVVPLGWQLLNTNGAAARPKLIDLADVIYYPTTPLTDGDIAQFNGAGFNIQQPLIDEGRY